MKISEVISHLEPDDQTTINNMVSKAKLNGDATIDQLRAAYPHTGPDITKDELSALVSLVYKRPNKFAPKLTFTHRCEILALHRKGITREAISAMYAVDRRTVTHIYTDNSPHYKNVREEETSLGRVKFMETYLKPDNYRRALAYSDTNKKVESVNNRQATNKAGIHAMRGPMCTFDHRVVIQWREPDGDIQVAGWYYKDLDSDLPDRWFCVGEESCKTSQACYLAAMEDIADKINPS